MIEGISKILDWIGYLLYLLYVIMPWVLKIGGVLLLAIVLFDAIKYRRWYLLVYALPFLPVVRAYVNIVLGIFIASVLALILHQTIWRKQPRNKARLEAVKNSQPKTIITSPGFNATGQQPMYQPYQAPATNNSNDNSFRIETKRDLTAFNKVVGMEKAKTELRDAIELPLEHPDQIKKYDLKPASGLILYGPPGTGKTHLARAAASYFGAEFFLVNATSIIGQYVGTTEAAVKEIFQKARSKTPSIIFFDEIDSIGQRRDSRNMNRPSDIVLNLLLTELDGFQKREGVFVIAATNRIDVLDEALLRPGRFELQIEIPAPNENERVALLAFFGKNKPLDPALNLQTIARETKGLTGAYLEGIVNGAAKRALKRAIKTGQDETITNEDFLAVLPEVGIKGLH